MGYNIELRTIVIAEIGRNHYGNMDLAREMIYEAKMAGADIIKTQVYDTDKFKLNKQLREDFKASEFTEDTLREFKECCDCVRVEFMASVFDSERVEWVERLGMKRYKIASRSVSDKSLINKICSTNKDMIVSLGMWNKIEMPKIRTKGNIYYLYCVSDYPTKIEDIIMPCFENSKYVGFSDHTVGTDAMLVAVARGAKIIEKHFTTDRNLKGYDNKFSIEPEELADAIEKIRAIERVISVNGVRK